MAKETRKLKKQAIFWDIVFFIYIFADKAEQHITICYLNNRKQYTNWHLENVSNKISCRKV